MIGIIEIGDIAWQGVTEPIFCRGGDNNDYVVKGQRAGRKALIAEWVASRLGRVLGLPIPEIALMRLDPEMLSFSTSTDKVKHLGTGTLFGSRRIPNVVELRHSDISLIAGDLRARVLAFDWWICNSDRVFVEGGGNPNLLWSDATGDLTVIDHNLAFDRSMMGNFWTEHAFRDDVLLWTESWRSRMKADLQSTLAQLTKIWRELPEDWTEIEGQLTFAEVESLLWRFEREADTFWRPV